MTTMCSHQLPWLVALADATARAGEHELDALERDVGARWQEFVLNGSLSLQAGMTTASAIK